jgi:hypothetical protein
MKQQLMTLSWKETLLFGEIFQVQLQAMVTR